MKRTYLSDGDFVGLCNTLRRRRADLRGSFTDSEIAAEMRKPKGDGGIGCHLITTSHIGRARRALGWAKEAAAPKADPTVLRLVNNIATAISALQMALGGGRATRKAAMPGAHVLDRMRQKLLAGIDRGELAASFRTVDAFKFLRASGTTVTALLAHLVASNEITRHSTGKTRNGRPMFSYTRNRRLTGLETAAV